MENNYNSTQPPRHKARTSPYIKWPLRIIGILAFLVIIAYLGMAFYINHNKKEVLASLTASLNENLNGSLTIGSMEPAFLEGFPLLSLNLKNVVITDSLYAQHKQALLRANNFDISVNALALLRGAVEIKKIGISDAIINIYTDSSGYSNTNVFRKNPKGEKGKGGGYPEIRKFSLDNVAIAIDNQSKRKLFNFKVRRLKGGINYNTSGWKADINLNTHVNSMAFNTKKGSFAKGKDVTGDLGIAFDREKELLKVFPSQLEIGHEDFSVAANFELGKMASKYTIEIKTDKIKWVKAASLLARNISDRLNLYDLHDPIAVSCNIAGDFNVAGDPLIIVSAKIRKNTLETPGGSVSNCSFDGGFINGNAAGAGYNDANSAVKFRNFEGDFAGIPIRMPKAAILNFEKPIAKGEFTAAFDVEKLGNLIDPDLVAFTKGKASVALSYTADIVNFRLAKPIVAGTVNIQNADVKYSPRNLQFKDISVALNFKDENLFISNIHLRSGKSVVDMQGEIRNFLNLYYTAPEKMVLKWNVASPQLHLGEFIGFLGQRKAGMPKRSAKKGNFTREANTLFEKSNVDMHLKVDKLYYNDFYASDVIADLSLNAVGITVRNGALKHAGGNMKVDGTLVQKPFGSRYDINALVLNVDVSRFFTAFDSFGLESLQPQNLKGFASAKARLTGTVSGSGSLVPKSMKGDVLFSLRKGALLDFAPVRNIGKYAFPFRDFNNIAIESLDGEFDIEGEQVRILPMKINSSILNMDVEGVYSFGTGTEIFITVPLRDPGRDKAVTDKEELEKRRKRGVVVNLIAKDGKDGKVKIGLGKKGKE